jgi:hypothetical protein
MSDFLFADLEEAVEIDRKRDFDEISPNLLRCGPFFEPRPRSLVFL